MVSDFLFRIIIIYLSKYVPVYTPPEERDFLSRLGDLKYEETLKDPNKYFKNLKIVNFDLIHHECRGDPLEKDIREHFAIQNQDFKKYPKNEKREVVGGALRNQDKTKQEIFIKKDIILQHFLNK